MKSIPIVLVLAAAGSLLAGCASAGPTRAEPTMGPQSARYITSSHRRAFQDRLNAAADAKVARRAAVADAARRGAEVAEQVAAAQEAPAAAPPPPPPPPPPAPIGTSTIGKGPRPGAPVAATPKPVELRSRPAARPKFELPPGREIPAAPKWPRRFVRMKIVGISAGSSDSNEVRSQIEAVRGVREVVINSRTGTAIVVVDTDVDPVNVLRAVKPPYSANLLR